MTAPVRTEASNGILTITLDRPKANAINVATSRALYAAFQQLQDDPALRVAILTGSGFSVESHVSAGVGHSIDQGGLELGGRFRARVLG